MIASPSRANRWKERARLLFTGLTIQSRGVSKEIWECSYCWRDPRYSREVSSFAEDTAEGETGAPVWSRSGRELYYADDVQLWAMGIQTEPTLEWKNPVALFEAPWPLFSSGSVNYDVTTDGQQFVFVQPLPSESDDRSSQINVVLNWFEELKKGVPIH